MNGFALTLKYNWLRLNFNHCEVRLKGNNNLYFKYKGTGAGGGSKIAQYRVTEFMNGPNS